MDLNRFKLSKNILSNQIMDYYVRFGQNRDLEKYLRCRNATRSSSEGSINALCDRREDFGTKLGKSMENLSTLRKNEPEFMKEVEKEDDKKSVSLKKADEVKSVVVKETRKEKKSGKNYNFNVESVIEIKMPEYPQQQVFLPPQVEAPKVYHHPQSTSTQTILDKSISFEEPIKPHKKPAIMAEEVRKDETLDLSPVSSITSNKQRLEWDSLGDIGYDSNDQFYFCAANELNSQERKDLRRYFVKKGLDFDKNVVVVKNLQTPKKPEAKQMTSKEKWVDIFQKYKQKYPHSEQNSINLQLPDAQSTPKPPPIKDQNEEKATQTSLIKILSKSVQAEGNHSDKNIGTDTLATSNSGPAEIVESFEFYSSSPQTSNPKEVASSKSDSSSMYSSIQQTSFEDEVKMGITLFHTIMESKSMPMNVKKSLVDKIFRKITKHDGQNRQKDDLLKDFGYLSKSKSNSCSESVENIYDKVEPQQQDDERLIVSSRSDRSERNEEKISDSFERLSIKSSQKSSTTKTGQDKSQERSSSSSAKVASKSANNSKSNSSTQSSLKSGIVPSSSRKSSLKSENIPKSDENGSKSSSDKRMKKAMKECLQPMTHSEIEYQNLQRPQMPIVEFFKKEKQSQLLKIETEIEHLKKMKKLLLENHDEIMRPPPVSFQVPNDKKENKENLYENTGTRPKSVNSSTIYTSVRGDTTGSWDSHCHMKKMIKNRSKLETPSSDESIVTFINNRKEKFKTSYDRQRHRMFEDNHIYTKPYSGKPSKQLENYSQLDPKYNIRKIPSSTQTQTSNSDLFISSDSVSIPSHHYDMKLDLNYKRVATQTTDSILRTKPIMESQESTKMCHCRCNCHCASETKTEIVDKTKHHKHQQTKPSSVAYVIEFKGDSNPKSNPKRNSESEKSHLSDSAASSEKEKGELDTLSLKEHLNKMRPNLFSRFEQRRKCVNELNKLRSLRNEQRRKLLLLSSDDTLKKDEYKKLPPPPLSQQRLFSTKALKENTRRQYKNLPEVLRKKEIEKINNLKKKTRIMTDIFNKNLQRKVLKGNIDLSNSIRVIKD